MTRIRPQARRALDHRLQKLRPLVNEPRPPRGWVRALRDAMGMSGVELAARMGVGQSTITDIERSERAGAIKLETLRRAADALDCEVVYFLVPRTSLEDAVRAQARRRALHHLRRVGHHSRLEDQSVDEDGTHAQLEELTTRFVDRRGLWAGEHSPT